MTDPIAHLFTLGFGPWLIPLRGKIAVLDAWQELPPVDEDMVRGWVRHNYNLGLRTGPKSGVIVIDDDQQRHGVPEADRFVPPTTGLVVSTPTGGWHHYYRCPAVPPKNSASVIAPYVDVKSDGGYVAVPPSIHPVARTAYQWSADGEPVEVPQSVLDLLAQSAPVRVNMKSPVPGNLPTGTGYANTALLREVHAVRTATEGTRNNILNRAAYSIAQLVGGGEIPEAKARDELRSAALLAGLDESETDGTIQSAFSSGMLLPRTRPEPAARTAKRTATVDPDAPNVVEAGILTPGSHQTPGGYVEQGNHKFASEVLATLDPSALYRRSSAVGEIHNGSFVVISPDRLRSIIDHTARLTGTKLVEGKAEYVYRVCTRDQAAIVIEYAAVRGTVRELRHIATHPVCVGPDFMPAKPGWNPDSGVYLACDLHPDPLDLDEARAVLEDLVCDFPFATPADRANFFGFLLTIVLRPAIVEPVPMHLIGSPVERTGKTKLAEIVAGCGLIGRPTPAMQIGVREEEREKRITAALLAGDSVIHLDNLHDFVDSAALASLLTSSVYRGRELGHTRLLSLPNGVTIVGTGNNVHATGEISKRVMPIMLHPDTEAPEQRQDYRHPLLRAYVEAQRPRTIGALFGLIAHWRAACKPLGGVGFGGFERWSAVVGGIMVAAGYPEWGANLNAWRGTSDDFSSELRAFVQIWATEHATQWIEIGDLFTLAERNEFFERKLTQSTPSGRKTVFSQRVINAAANRVVGGWRIEVAGDGKKRRARLVSPE